MQPVANRSRGIARAACIGAVEAVLPLLLTAGLLLPGEDLWRQALEAALLPTFGWYAWRYGLGGWRAVRLLAIPVAWVAWLGLSGGWGGPEVRAEWDTASMEALQTGVFFLLCVILVRVTPVVRLEWIAAALVLASGVNLAAGLAQHFATHGVSLVPRIMGVGLFENPNRAAALIGLMLLFAMHLVACTGNTLIRIAALFFMPLAAVYIVFTGSRGGVVVIAATVLAYIAVSGGRAAATRFLLAGGVMLVLGGAALLLFPAAGEPVWQNLSRNTYRAEIWQGTWALAMERPFLGHGYDFEKPILGRFTHPHDIHLSNLLYGGLPALALGLATLCAAAIMAGTLANRRCRALTTAAIVLVVLWTIPNGGVPISKPSDDWYHFWIPVALAFGLALRSADRPATRTGTLP